jgi:hypothetical protein
MLRNPAINTAKVRDGQASASNMGMISQELYSCQASFFIFIASGGYRLPD